MSQPKTLIPHRSAERMYDALVKMEHQLNLCLDVLYANPASELRSVVGVLESVTDDVRDLHPVSNKLQKALYANFLANDASDKQQGSAKKRTANRAEVMA